MRNSLLLGVMLFLGFLGSAFAACVDGGTPVTDVAVLLNGKTVCHGPVGNRNWQEFHTSGGGALIDYKRGPGHAVDPSETVGNWSASGGEVSYDYGNGQVFKYIIYDRSGSYDFCPVAGQGAEVSGAILVSGSNGCGDPN